jgi:hypothetical protein
MSRTRLIRRLGWSARRTCEYVVQPEYDDISAAELLRWADATEARRVSCYLRHAIEQGPYEQDNYFCAYPNTAYLEPTHGLAIAARRHFVCESLPWSKHYGFAFPYLAGEMFGRHVERKFDCPVVSLRSVFETGGYFHLYLGVLGKLVILAKHLDLRTLPIVVTQSLEHDSAFKQVGRMLEATLGFALRWVFQSNERICAPQFYFSKTPYYSAEFYRGLNQLLGTDKVALVTSASSCIGRRVVRAA